MEVCVVVKKILILLLFIVLLSHVLVGRQAATSGNNGINKRINAEASVQVNLVILSSSKISIDDDHVGGRRDCICL